MTAAFQEAMTLKGVEMGMSRTFVRGWLGFRKWCMVSSTILYL
jgi:hypothetical protein